MQIHLTQVLALIPVLALTPLFTLTPILDLTPLLVLSTTEPVVPVSCPGWWCLHQDFLFSFHFFSLFLFISCVGKQVLYILIIRIKFFELFDSPSNTHTHTQSSTKLSTTIKWQILNGTVAAECSSMIVHFCLCRKRTSIFSEQTRSQ